MRAAVVLIVVVSVAAFFGSKFLTGVTLADPGYLFAMAFGEPLGEPFGDDVPMHLAIPPQVSLVDPPDSNARGIAMWKDWIKDHFELRDENGTVIPLRKIGTSGLMVGEKSAGAPEFVLCADLKREATYTFHFVPRLSESKRYACTFLVPTEATRPWRKKFERVAE